MNNRIRLMAKAHQAFTESRITSPEVEKFMEIIVEECVQVIEEAVNQREPASTYTTKIKNHFGI
jgi:hypothetical protein